MNLTLPIKGIYFEQIKAGEKVEEFRLITPYWQRRLEGRTFDKVVLTKGYPKGSDDSRRLVLPWRGYVRKRVTHPHFGPEEVEVYAIRLYG